eukprot:SAG31_NODE_1364_length_8625_cov_8.137696_5_plen_151_part_00
MVVAWRLAAAPALGGPAIIISMRVHLSRAGKVVGETRGCAIVGARGRGQALRLTQSDRAVRACRCRADVQHAGPAGGVCRMVAWEKQPDRHRMIRHIRRGGPRARAYPDSYLKFRGPAGGRRGRGRRRGAGRRACDYGNIGRTNLDVIFL